MLSSTQPDFFAASHTPAKIYDVKTSLIEMKQQGQTNAQLLGWLQEQGIRAGATTGCCCVVVLGTFLALHHLDKLDQHDLDSSHHLDISLNRSH